MSETPTFKALLPFRVWRESEDVKVWLPRPSWLSGCQRVLYLGNHSLIGQNGAGSGKGKLQYPLWPGGGAQVQRGGSFRGQGWQFSQGHQAPGAAWVHGPAPGTVLFGYRNMKRLTLCHGTWFLTLPRGLDLLPSQILWTLQNPDNRSHFFPKVVRLGFHCCPSRTP